MIPDFIKNLPLSVSSKLQDFGIGLLKGAGELSTTPGYLADLMTGKGFESDLTSDKINQQKTALAPTNLTQRIGHTIGSLSPGMEAIRPGLEKVGVPGGLAFGIGLGVDVVTPGPGETKVFKGFQDLTTKVLDRLKGKTTVSKQFISDLTNMPELKQAERDLIRNVVGDYKGDVPVQDFANKVKTELLPLKSNKHKDLYVQSGGKYEHVVLPDDLRGPIANYKERIYESPIKTSAGDVHFSEQNNANYFAHTRIEDLPIEKRNLKFNAKGLIDPKNGEMIAPTRNQEEYRALQSKFTTPGDTRRVIELQSDLFQKGRLEKEVEYAKFDNTNVGYEVAQPKKADPRQIEGLQKLEPYRNTWHERVIREEVKQAAKDGKTKLQFPTGETAMKIEGLGDMTRWRLGAVDDAGEDLIGTAMEKEYVGNTINNGNSDWIITDILGDGKFKAVPKRLFEQARSNMPGYAEEGRHKIPIQKVIDYLKEGSEGWMETFDISGKVDQNNPIYKFYEKEVGRYLKNKYGAEMITDPQGVKWWQLDVKKEQGRLPVEAFALAPLMIPTKDNKK